MCKGKRDFLRGLLIAFSVLALIECGCHAYLIGYPETSTTSMVSDILYCVLLFAVAIVGLVFYCKENFFLAIAYASPILALITIDLLSIIFDRGKVSGRTIVEKAWDEAKTHSELMNELQRKFRCCGKNSASDYPDLYNLAVPKSCYRNNDTVPYEKGCFDAVRGVNYTVLYWGSLLFHILWLAFACYFIWELRKQMLANRRNSVTKNEK